MTEEVARGRVGLNNLGNTCFMNAGIQCLLHSPELILPFLDTIEDPIEGQTNNKYKMVRGFAKLVRSHYNTSLKSQSPQEFRKSINRIAPFLCDGDQHDSHEMINFILQGLEEELNKHEEGGYHAENNYTPENDVDEEYIKEELMERGKEWWNHYKSYNDCFITDVLYGEICNHIQCTKCKQSVYNYSAFNTLYVPVKKTTVLVNINLVIQQYDVDMNQACISFYNVVLSMKENDLVKMMDVRLKDRFDYRTTNSIFDSSQSVAPQDFKSSRIVFLQGTLHKVTKQYLYTRLDMDRCINQIDKNSVILAYLVPPVPLGSIPLFIETTTMISVSTVENPASSSPLGQNTWRFLPIAPPLLLIVRKTDTIRRVRERMDQVMTLYEKGTLSTNKTNKKEREMYANPYCSICINVDYMCSGPFFYAGEEGSTVVETEKSEENAENAENAEEEKTCFPLLCLERMSLQTSSRIDVTSLLNINETSHFDTVLSDVMVRSPMEKEFLTLFIILSCNITAKVKGVFDYMGIKSGGVFASQWVASMNCECSRFDLREEEGNRSNVSSSWGKRKEEEGSSILNLQDCFELNKKTTVLMNGDSCCQHCHEKTSLETTPLLCRLPPLLMIQMKRFEYCASSSLGLFDRKGRSLTGKHGFGRKKIDAYVNYPIKELEMRDYLIEPLRDSITNPNETKYELIGVVNHSGTADFGHYYAYCKDGYNGRDNWFEYNDSFVSAIKEEGVVTKNAYVLVYRRMDLGNAIYGKISSMSINTGKKEAPVMDQVAQVFSESVKEMKLERSRKSGVDMEEKASVVEEKDSKGKRRISKHERNEMKKREQDTKNRTKAT